MIHIISFLDGRLKLKLHPNKLPRTNSPRKTVIAAFIPALRKRGFLRCDYKIVFRKLDWGIDYLGYIVLPHYILPRTKTKRRIFTKLKLKVNDPNFNQLLQSYLGYLSHANSYKLEQKLRNQIWFGVTI